MAATGFISMWVSNTATAVMMLPIGVSVLLLVGSMTNEINVPASEGGHADTSSQEVKDAVIQSKFGTRSEEHTSELQSLMRISYAVFCLKKKKKTLNTHI